MTGLVVVVGLMFRSRCHSQARKLSTTSPSTKITTTSSAKLASSFRTPGLAAAVITGPTFNNGSEMLLKKLRSTPKTLAEREDISRGIAAGSSIRAIDRGLQRPVSTVSREVLRHGSRPLYRASEADREAWESALRPKTCFLPNHEELRSIVVSKLILDWSPEQISKWLKVVVALQP